MVPPLALLSAPHWRVIYITRRTPGCQSPHLQDAGIKVRKSLKVWKDHRSRGWGEHGNGGCPRRRDVTQETDALDSRVQLDIPQALQLVEMPRNPASTRLARERTDVAPGGMVIMRGVIRCYCLEHQS